MPTFVSPPVVHVLITPLHRTVIVGTAPFKSRPEAFYTKLYERFPYIANIVIQLRTNQPHHKDANAFFITPSNPVQTLELELPSREHLAKVRERRKGDTERCLLKKLRLRENAGEVSMMMDTRGMKNVLSTCKKLSNLVAGLRRRQRRHQARSYQRGHSARLYQTRVRPRRSATSSPPDPPYSPL